MRDPKGVARNMIIFWFFRWGSNAVFTKKNDEILNFPMEIVLTL